MAQNTGNHAAHCEWCPQEWDVTPELQVDCPSKACTAKAGSPCTRPSGHTAWEFHPDRQRKAIREGIVDKKICRGLCLSGKKVAVAREAVLQRLREQFPGRDIVPWEATYAAVAEVVGSAPPLTPPAAPPTAAKPARQPAPRKRSLQTLRPIQPPLFQTTQEDLSQYDI